ncbi:MAG: hypothetical protein N3A53_07885 [Verrucomicrobiae bacterium]|nr:hypothetical protein [Verrucomicrobiae bacterium]
MGEEFRVPPDVLIIGTMNTADRTTALREVALRKTVGRGRRFAQMFAN